MYYESVMEKSRPQSEIQSEGTREEIIVKPAREKVWKTTKLILSYVVAFLIGIGAGIIVEGLHPFQSKIPWDVYTSETRTHLLVRNPSGEVISSYSTEAEITGHLLLDIDKDNEKELLVATACLGKDKPGGKLLLYDSGRWEEFYVPQTEFGDSVSGVQDFAALGKVEALALLVNDRSEWSMGRLILLDYFGNPIVDATDSSKGILHSILVCDNAEWDGDAQGTVSFILQGWGLYETHATDEESALANNPSSIIPDGATGTTPFYYSVGFYRTYRLEQELKLKPVWIFRVEPKGTVVRDLYPHDDDSNEKTDYITFWHSYKYQYKFTPTWVSEWPLHGPFFSPLLSLRPKIEFHSASSEAYMNREQICFQLARGRWLDEKWSDETKGKWCDLPEQ